jgi:GTP-binding protein YchF
MKIALLGLPQAGKKTLFSLLTNRDVPPSHQPHETLDGMAPVRDPRLDGLGDLVGRERRVYAQNDYALCPDVTEGDHTRAWLSAARQCDLLCLVLRAFESDAVYHPAGSVDPERDRRNIEAELMLADMELADKRLERIAKEKRAGQTPAQALEERTLRKCMEAMEADKRLADIDLEDQELGAVRSLEFVTLKPALCTYNVPEDDIGRRHGEGTVAVSAKIEQEILAIEDPDERREYQQAIGLEASGLDRMNAAAYDALGLMSFYTIGKDEVRAWTIRKGSTAPVAAGKVHRDMERGFIRVEIVKFGDLMQAGSEHAAKEHGKVLTKGKDYVIEDGDVCHFLFSV